jgi:hypothetical protein
MLLKTLQNLNRCKGSASIVAAGLLVAAVGSAASAAIIAPGQTLPTAGAGLFNGVPLLNTGLVPFAGKDILGNTVFTGELNSQVFADPANPFGAGDLDFVYQFSNDPNQNNDNILHLAATSFSGLLTNVDYVAGSGSAGVLPTTISRDAANAGDTVDFDFSLATSVKPGATTPFLVIQTNATAFTPNGSISIQDGGNVTLSAPAPLSVPEPATFAITGLTMVALGMRRRVSK